MKGSELAAIWTGIQAPTTGDIRTELVREAAEYLGIGVQDAWDRLRGAGDRFRDEWSRTVGGSTDAATLTQFYNHSDAELFELIEWHASDPIHFRTLILRDAALRQRGRAYLDYGSGIGSDAVAFAAAGFDVTVADISDVLMGFAAFRCRKHGSRLRTIDLKSQTLPPNAYDVAVCFDVLEHIPKPIPVVRRIREALRPSALFAIHAPFGVDPERPMHVAHRDVVTPRMRSFGFQPLDLHFPPPVLAPQVYRKVDLPLRDRVGYFVYDVYMKNNTGSQIADIYRRIFAAPHLERAS
ncbi:MAG: methyltransferase domain-containing protein [Vicinamibacterales bacterium]